MHHKNGDLYDDRGKVCFSVFRGCIGLCLCEVDEVDEVTQMGYVNGGIIGQM